MKRLFYVIALSAVLFSCKKDEEPTPVTPTTPTDYTHGTFTVNEGGFGNNNGGISYINASGTVVADLYFDVNGVGLGDVMQSFTVIGTKGYAVVNNSQKVEVFDIRTFQHSATISSISYPRHLLAVSSNTAYLTNGSMAGDVQVIDLSTNTVSTTIAVGNGPEKMVTNGTHVFVCNSGGWDLDNTVSVIEIATNTVVETITVGDRPMDAAIDADGDVWVICSGNASWMTGGETAAALYKIDGTTFDIVSNQTVGTLGQHPQHIEVSPSGSTIYYENEGVFAFEANGGTLPGNEIVTDARASIHVHPATGEIWCAGVSDFVNPSVVYKYSTTGTQEASYTTSLGTNAVVFN